MIGLVSAVVRGLTRPAAPSPVPLPPGVVLRRSRWIPRIAGRLSRMAGPAGAVTLGRTIVLEDSVEPTERLLRHELAHVRQWERQPFAFPFRYVAAHIRHGYGQNPYEAEARAEETGRGRSGEGK